MLSEELDLACEKVTAEWVHIEICRPMCNVLNIFDEKNFEFLDAICNAHDVVKFKQQVTQNITNCLAALDDLKKLMDEQSKMCLENEVDIKVATVLPVYDSFLEMQLVLGVARDYVSVHTEIVEKGYGFGDNENVIFYRNLLMEKLDSYKKFRKESGYVTGN